MSSLMHDVVSERTKNEISEMKISSRILGLRECNRLQVRHALDNESAPLSENLMRKKKTLWTIFIYFNVKL